MTEAPAPDAYNRTALFWICVLALFTAAVAFSMRTAASDAIRQAVFDPIDPANSGRMIGGALGAAFSGFAFSLLVLSPFLDVIGAKRVLLLAACSFVGGSLLMVLAPSMGSGAGIGTLVTLGMALTGVGWGCTEASINPMTAALYPADKTHRLNVLHAWWPAGIVVGGLASIGVGQIGLDWRWDIALIMVPGIAFGLWTLTQKFPPTESAALGVGFGEMIAVPFKRPTFWIFFAIMFLTASAELAPGSWVDVALTHTVGMEGILLLVYVSAIMFVMRHFAEGIVTPRVRHGAVVAVHHTGGAGPVFAEHRFVARDRPGRGDGVGEWASRSCGRPCWRRCRIAIRAAGPGRSGWSALPARWRSSSCCPSWARSTTRPSWSGRAARRPLPRCSPVQC